MGSHGRQYIDERHRSNGTREREGESEEGNGDRERERYAERGRMDRDTLRTNELVARFE